MEVVIESNSSDFKYAINTTAAIAIKGGFLVMMHLIAYTACS